MDHDRGKCMLCPRGCGADRNNGYGRCGAGRAVRLARAALHYGEEPCISGKEGSGAVFFSGCSLACVFCQNREISAGLFGKDVTARELADIFRRLEEAGANNIDLVTPTHYSADIIEALSLYRPGIPVLYNCSGYEKPETLRALAPYVDVWLPDFKYSDPELAGRLSGAPDYPETAVKAIGEMLSLAGPPEFDSRGMIRKGVIIRHLVLPLHLQNTFGVLDTIAERFGTDTWISLLFQYTPVVHLPEMPELNRCLTKRERDRAERYLEEKGFMNGYVQERESRGSGYIPEFDLTGV